MRQFIERALGKADKLKCEQVHQLLVLAAGEIDSLERVMDSLPRGILVCDISHKLLLANKAARRFLSIASYEHARENVWNVIPERAVADFLAQTLLDADKAEEREFDTEINGMPRLLSVSVMPLVQDRQVSGSLILVDDITERRSREARMRRMENLASLTSLAAGVAHEIKNPLGSLSIHVQLIQKAMAAQKKICFDIASAREGAEPCEPKDYFSQIDRYLNVVNEEIDRLNSIVVDFLFAVRPMKVELRRGDINAFIRELLDFVSFELKESNIKTVMNLAENLGPLDFDSGLMKQALLNLLNNAAAAMGGGGTLSISTEEAPGEIRINVADTGAGISEENLAKIFEPYFSTKDTGTGLGLTMVFKVVKEHGGEIGVKSKEGEGTVFSISLPVPQLDRPLLAFQAAAEGGRN